MNLLLDTQTLLWWLADDELTIEARSLLADPSNPAVVSAASFWEIGIKVRIGKLRVDVPLAPVVVEQGFELLPISADHAEAAGALPQVHRDPFDRMLVAQARAEGLTIMTRDPAFDRYDVDVIAC